MTTRRVIEITELIALDYYDGPLSGVICTREDECLIFDTVARDESTDLKVYCLAPFTTKANHLDKIREILRPQIGQGGPLWVPVWQFSSSESQQKCETEIDDILMLAGEYSMKLITQDLKLGSFSSCSLTRFEKEEALRFRNEKKPLLASDWIPMELHKPNP